MRLRLTLMLMLFLTPQYLFANKENIYGDTIEVSGTIVAKDDVIVRSGYFGIISEIYVRKGDTVYKGQPIAKISPVTDYEKLELAQSNYEQSQTLHLREVSNYNKVRELYSKSLISEQEYLAAEDKKKISYLETQKYKRQIDMALTGDSTFNKKDNNVVYASIEGTIVDINVIPGDHILSSLNYNEGTAIVRIANLNEMIFLGEVEEGVVSKLSKGNRAVLKIIAYPESSFAGKIEDISLIAVQSSGKVYFPLRIKIDNFDSHLKRIGLSAQSRIFFRNRPNFLSKN